MGASNGSANGVAGGLFSSLNTNTPVVVKREPPARPAGPVKVSSGVIAGLAISKPEPVYPAIARAAHVQGAVILHAVISKTGTIEGLTVVSGPPMLQQAAMDAVRSWRYKPYLLNGEPVEVGTQVNVVFSLGG